MNNRKSPNWLLIVLGIIAAVVLGPPLLGLALGAVGLLIGLMTVVAKVGVVVLAVWGLVMLMRGLFGGSPRVVTEGAPPSAMTVDAMHADLERRDREDRAALDRELELAIQKKGSAGA